MYSHILLAIDGSEHAVRAANHAVNIAVFIPNCTVEILYVIDPGKVKEEVLHAQNHEEIEYHRRQKLVPVQEKLENNQVSYTVTIITGDPGPTIVEYARQHSVDLIVIGSRGRNALQEFVLGSVSHKVVKRADCPVMIVK